MAPTDAQLQALFDYFDTSGDGFLSEEELEAALSKAGKKTDSAEIQFILSRADKNSDGKIDFDEFKTVFLVAPDTLPGGIKTLVDVGSSMISGELIVDGFSALGKAFGSITRRLSTAASSLLGMEGQTYDDLAQLPTIDDMAVTHALEHRHDNGDKLLNNGGGVYTRLGSVLVAMNPYRTVALYTDAHLKHFTDASTEASAPHIFAVAAAAHHDLMTSGKMQAVLMSGESGAGKTESARHVLECLRYCGGGGGGDLEACLQSSQVRASHHAPRRALASHTPPRMPLACHAARPLVCALH